MENLLDWSVRDRRQYFFSLQGVLKIIEIILVIVTLGLARGGDGGFDIVFDYVFIVVGTSMFLTITLLLFTISTLMDHQPPALLDSILTITGAILMITAGALCLSFYVPRYKAGGLLFKNAKVSVRV